MRTSALFLAATLALPIPACAAIALRFDAPLYEVPPDGDFIIQVLMDGDDQVPGDQPVPNGLFSYGVKLSFPGENAETFPGALDVVSALDYNGFLPGAITELQENGILSKGNISLTQADSPTYLASPLFTVLFRNAAPVGAEYSLSLEPLGTNPSQTVFLDGEGTPLDDSITFGTARVLVVERSPEPLLLEIRPSAAGGVEISFPLQPGRAHFLEASTDLQAWSDVFPTPLEEGSLVLPASIPARFFRLRTE